MQYFDNFLYSFIEKQDQCNRTIETSRYHSMKFVQSLKYNSQKFIQPMQLCTVTRPDTN